MASQLTPVTIEVKTALNADIVATIQVESWQRIHEVKTHLSQLLHVHTACQVLIAEGQSVPLRDVQTLQDCGLGLGGGILLVQQQIEDPLRKLWGQCIGCFCDFDAVLLQNANHRQTHHCQWFPFLCQCEDARAKYNNPVSMNDHQRESAECVRNTRYSISELQEWEIRFLLNAIEGHATSLQHLFERMVVGCNATATRAMLDDLRVDLNTRYDPHFNPDGLPNLVAAAALYQPETFRILAGSHRLNQRPEWHPYNPSQPESLHLLNVCSQQEFSHFEFCRNYVRAWKEMQDDQDDWDEWEAYLDAEQDLDETSARADWSNKGAHVRKLRQTRKPGPQHEKTPQPVPDRKHQHHVKEDRRRTAHDQKQRRQHGLAGLELLRAAMSMSLE